MTLPGPLAVAVAWADGADRGLPLPAYQSEGAAGADLRANLPEPARLGGLSLAPGERAAVPTGLRLAIPPGWEGQVRMRSGLALRHGLTCPNAPGTVDADYRGEVLVIVQNNGAAPVTIRHGDRIAQLVLAPVGRARFEPGDLDATTRGAAGFGSTGVSGPGASESGASGPGASGPGASGPEALEGVTG